MVTTSTCFTAPLGSRPEATFPSAGVLACVHEASASAEIQALSVATDMLPYVSGGGLSGNRFVHHGRRVPSGARDVARCPR